MMLNTPLLRILNGVGGKVSAYEFIDKLESKLNAKKELV